MRHQEIALPSPAPGTQRILRIVEFGEPDARPKVYVQAALHADEIPPLLVACRLSELLREAERTGRLQGHVVLVPLANPIGSDQYVTGSHLGRYELGSGGNFNRNHPDLGDAVAGRVAGRLVDDAAQNVSRIRAAALTELSEMQPASEADVLRHILLSRAIDADIVLDLHSDNEAILHLYLGTPLWPDAEDLPAWLGARVTLLAEVSGGHPFDEACSGLWWSLQRRFPDHEIPNACLAATVELRGERDVDEALACADAQAICGFLCERGVLAGEVRRPPWSADARPLEGVAMIKAPRAGIVCYHLEPGDAVAAGQCIATVIDPQPADPDLTGEAQAVTSPVDGIVFARRSNRLARPGQILCKVSASEPISERAGTHLLSD